MQQSRKNNFLFYFIYAAQPFEVGSKSGKSRSLALVIPHEVVRHYGISTSTVIIIKTDHISNAITLETIYDQNCQGYQSKISDTNENALAASTEKFKTSMKER
jgi:hypothetical protein